MVANKIMTFTCVMTVILGIFVGATVEHFLKIFPVTTTGPQTNAVTLFTALTNGDKELADKFTSGAVNRNIGLTAAKQTGAVIQPVVTRNSISGIGAFLVEDVTVVTDEYVSFYAVEWFKGRAMRLTDITPVCTGGGTLTSSAAEDMLAVYSGFTKDICQGKTKEASRFLSGKALRTHEETMDKFNGLKQQEPVMQFISGQKDGKLAVIEIGLTQGKQTGSVLVHFYKLTSGWKIVNISSL